MIQVSVIPYVSVPHSQGMSSLVQSSTGQGWVEKSRKVENRSVWNRMISAFYNIQFHANGNCITVHLPSTYISPSFCYSQCFDPIKLFKLLSDISVKCSSTYPFPFYLLHFTLKIYVTNLIID